MIKEAAHILTSPINQTLIIFAVIALLYWRNVVTKITVWITIGITLLWLYLCAQPFFSQMLMAPIEQEFASVKASDKSWQNADAIWVLACLHYKNPALPDVSRWNHCSLQRLVHTYQMFQEKPSLIYVSGGAFTEDKDFSYAIEAKAFLVRLGVPETMIKVVDKGTNTKEELIGLLAEPSIAKINKLAIVSSSSHGRRLHKLMELNSHLEFQFVPVEHFNLSNPSIGLGWPSINSIKKSQRAIYTYFANLEIALFE
ncbi:YdcF family protein [Glaciecola sp. MF2-115]|uniref:YdcF family protein n=1 Tax=Glaciecola sp. MF2-115 TaxID=3384827 RepID=UPI00399F879B